MAPGCSCKERILRSDTPRLTTSSSNICNAWYSSKPAVLGRLVPAIGTRDRAPSTSRGALAAFVSLPDGVQLHGTQHPPDPHSVGLSNDVKEGEERNASRNSHLVEWIHHLLVESAVQAAPRPPAASTCRWKRHHSWLAHLSTKAGVTPTEC